MNTPIGNVKPHQPMLNGKLFALYIVATAKKSHTRPNPQRINAVMNPKIYRNGPARGWRELVRGKIRMATRPSSIILRISVMS
jgi:hypothetical protein